MSTRREQPREELIFGRIKAKGRFAIKIAAFTIMSVLYLYTISLVRRFSFEEISTAYLISSFLFVVLVFAEIRPRVRPRIVVVPSV